MTTIAGLEIRVFRVLVSERAGATEPIAPLNRSNYDDQPARLLRLGHGIGNLQHELIARPSFKTRFRGVVVDSAFVHSRTVQELEIVGSWVAQNNLTLAVHDVIEIEDVFPAAVVKLLNALLGGFDRAVEPAVFESFAIFHAEAFHHVGHAVGGGEVTHQVVFEGEEELGFTGIALTGTTTAQLTINPT